MRNAESSLSADGASPGNPTICRNVGGYFRCGVYVSPLFTAIRCPPRLAEPGKYSSAFAPSRLLRRHPRHLAAISPATTIIAAAALRRRLSSSTGEPSCHASPATVLNKPDIGLSSDGARLRFAGTVRHHDERRRDGWRARATCAKLLAPDRSRVRHAQRRSLWHSASAKIRKPRSKARLSRKMPSVVNRGKSSHPGRVWRRFIRRRT